MGFHGHFHMRGRRGRGPRREKKEERKVSDIVILKRLLNYISVHRFRLAIVIILVIVSSLIRLITPQLTRIIIDDILTPTITVGSLDTEALTWWIVIFIGIACTSYILTYFRQYLLSYVGQNVLSKIRRNLFSRLQVLSISFFAEGETGRIMSIVSDDVEELNMFLEGGLIILISDAINIVGAIIFMVSMNLELTLVSLAMIPLMFIVVQLLGRRARKAWRETRESIAGVTSRLQEGISGIRVTQAFTREDVNVQNFDEANVENLQANLRAQRISGLFGIGMRLSTIIGTLLILWFSVNHILAGRMTLGTFQAFQGYLMMFTFPLMNLSNLYNILQAVMAASERIFDLFDTSLEVEEAPVALRVDLKDVKGAIEYKNISFSYDTGVSVLKNINITVKPNEKVAFVGPTGAGKSTLVNLLCRFYDPTEGKILLDGYDIKRVSLQSLRKQMGIVLQDTFLFQDTVRENIRYGEPEATDEEVIQAAKVVGAHDFIIRLPQGYDTIVHEGATNLSIGQKQLISFARGLLVNPRILILDEATSSVDPYTELILQEALQKLLTNRTAIIIAHRLSTVRNVDRIVVIDQGEIVEMDTHNALMEKGGLYSRLYKMQFREPDLKKTIAETE